MPDAMKPDLMLHPLFTANDVHGVVFDLDGTIIDSAADIIHGMRLTLQQAGIGTLPDDYFPDNLHGTSVGIIQYIIEDMGWAPPDDLSPILAAYTENYRALRHQNTKLYGGSLAVLQACRQAGLPLAICTNKVHISALSALEKVGLNGAFDFVSGCDTWAQAKPSPLPLLETIRMLDLEPGNCLYFGDTSVDAMCARDAGVRFVLHEAGYGDEALKTQTQHFNFRHWDELLVPAHGKADQHETRQQPVQALADTVE